MPSKTPATPAEVAVLYGVAKSTVHRWVESEAFDPAPMVLPSPSGERDRVLFDRDAVVKQFEAEMLDPRDLTPAVMLEDRKLRLKAFRDEAR